MHNLKVIYIVFSIFSLLATTTHAETVYITDELNIGLHQDRSVDSPIIKLLPSGTALTIIQRDNDLVYVRDTAGKQGWINNKYVLNEMPGKSRTVELEKKNAALQQEIKTLKANKPTVAVNNDAATKELERQLNSERLKVGELQAQLTNIKTDIANIDDSGKMLADLKDLKQQNRQLIAQLESSGIDVDISTAPIENESAVTLNGWQQILITCLIIFILGIASGAFMLDFNNRRRHGGFRV